MKRCLLLLLLCLVPLVAQAAEPEQAPVEGVDYIVNPHGKPWSPRAGTVEVVEVFGYTCPHCADFEPMLRAWKSRQPADVRVTSVPAAFGGYWLPYARAYFAADQLGLLARSHAAVFEALHVSGKLPIQNASALEIGSFYAQYGVTAEQFARTMESDPVQAKLQAARQFAAAAQIDGTPSMVVNGRYTVAAGRQGYGRMFEVVEWLVARERAATP